MTTVASGRCISAPSLVERAIGRNPKLATKAVIRTGRRRTSAVSWLTSRSFIPECRRCSAALTQTRPFRTATPNRAMKPTPAEMLNGMSRANSAKIPPDAAMGTARKMSIARRTDSRLVCSRMKMITRTIGVMISRRLLADCRFSKSPPSGFRSRRACQPSPQRRAARRPQMSRYRGHGHSPR